MATLLVCVGLVFCHCVKFLVALFFNGCHFLNALTRSLMH